MASNHHNASTTNMTNFVWNNINSKLIYVALEAGFKWEFQVPSPKMLPIKI